MSLEAAVAIPVADAATDVNLVNSSCRLLGFSLEAAAATTIYLRDDEAADTSAPVRAAVAFGTGADATKTVWFGDRGIRCNAGLMIERDATNNVSGVVYIA